MGEINLLILSSGRRVELINEFKRAKNKLGIEGKIIVADYCMEISSRYFADAYYKLPLVNDSEYLYELIDICNRERISIIIPTIDTELMILSKNKERIEALTGAKVLVSNEDVINISSNKKLTYNFFVENGFDTPLEITKDMIKMGCYNMPLFIKPTNGSSSINTFKLENEKELEFFSDYVNDPIVQEFIEGIEYTVDAFVDFKGNPISIVPRRRIATRGGEVLKGEIEKNMDIINESIKVLNALSCIGPITLQLIKNPKGIYFIEINARYGGGAPISINAGANTAEYLYRLLNNEEINFNIDFDDKLLGLRYDNCIYINREGEVVG